MREMPAPFLAPRTTLRIGGTAIAELVLERHEDLYLLQDKLKALGGKPLVLGAGSITRLGPAWLEGQNHA